MVGRTYTASFGGVAVTGAIDLFEITPADDKAIEVVGLFLSQNSDFGDAQDEILGFKISRGWTTGGSGGAAPTPTPMDGIDTAAGFAAETCNTTVAKEGTEVIAHQDSFNVRAGEKLWFPEGCGPHCSQGQTRLTVRLLVAPVDSLTMQGTIYVKEYS